MAAVTAPANVSEPPAEDTATTKVPDKTMVSVVPPVAASEPGAIADDPFGFAPPPGAPSAPAFPAGFAAPPPAPGASSPSGFFTKPPATAPAPFATPPPDPFAAPPPDAGASLVRAPSRPELGTERVDGGPGASAGSAPQPAAPPPGFGSGLGPSGLPAGIPDPFAAIADGAVPPGGPANGANPFADDGEDAPQLDASLKNALLGKSGSLTDEPDDIPGLAPRAPRPAAPPPMRGPAPEESLSLDSSRAPARPGVDSDEPIPKGPRPDDLRAKRPKRKTVVGVKLQDAVDGPKEPRAIYRGLLAVFFVGAFTGAFASLTDGSFQPSRLDRARLSIVFGPPAVDAAVAGLAITPDAGRYVDTAPGKPRVFVARGLAVNAGSVPRAFLEVRGRLKDATGKLLAETRVPCGNTFRDDQLRSLASADELARFYVPLGDNGANAKVDPGVAEPCVVVFFDAPAPDKVAEYDLEIVAAQSSSG
ncbi:MAG TPA: hypothetical protein VMV18_13190 [bacterium]|nr:hypothetical protein [bacterium]